MARLWTSGFELQSVTAGVEYLSNTGTAPTISTTTVRSGAAAIRFNPTAATSLIQITYAVGSVRRHFVRFAVRFASFPTADVPILQFWDGASAFPSLWLINSTKTLRVRDGNPADVSGDSAALSLNTWYVVQFDYDDTVSSPTTGPVNAYLDGTQFATNVPGWNIGGVGDIRIGICAAASADMFVDDVAINDVTGTTETGLPDVGGKVVLLLPDSAGDNNGFATAVGGTAGAANNFTRVDEVPPDDVTSYNQSTATGTTTIDDFNVASSASAGIGSGDTIKLVGVGIRAGSNAVTAASIVSRLKGQASGTTTESSSINVNVNGWRTGGVVAGGNPQPWANIVAYTNPQTSTAWTTTALDSMQIGYRGNVSQTTQRRISTVWATVEYVPSTATNGAASVAGAGSVTAGATVIVSASATGSGSVAATSTQGATSALAGTGSTAASAIQAVTASVTGAGSVAAASSQIQRAAATVTGAGSVSASAVQTLQGAASVSGAGSVSALVTARPSATQSGAGSVAAAITQTSASTVSGAGNVTANAGGTTNATAAATGAGAVSAIAALTAGGSATGTGTVAAAATVRPAATVTGQGSASASVTQPVTSSVTGAGVVSANPAGTVTGTASVTGAGSATASATTRSGSAVTGAGGVSASATMRASASLAGSGSASASARQAVTATITGAGSVTASIAIVISGTAAVAGLGNVTANTNSRITPRPYAGTTARPSSGITPRPLAGTTARP